MTHGFTLFLALCAFAVGPGYCSESKPTLLLASELAQAITGDEDIASAAKLEVNTALLARGLTKEAQDLADTISDYRRSIAHLDRADLWIANEGRKAEVDAIIESAKKQLPKVTPPGANSIRERLAQLLQKRGDASAASIIEAITDKETRAAAELQLAIIDLKPTQRLDLEHWQKRIKDVAKNAPFPGAIPAARELAIRGLQLIESETSTAETREQGRHLIEDADKLAQLSGVSYAETILPIAERLLVTEESHIAHRLILQAASEVKGMPPVYEMKSILSASLARCWHLSGQTAGAVSLLKEGEEFASGVQPMDQPRCLMALSQAWKKMPDDSASNRLQEQAIRIAAENPNPRVRVLAALAVCLSYDAVSSPMPEDLILRLRALAALQ